MCNIYNNRALELCFDVARVRAEGPRALDTSGHQVEEREVTENIIQSTDYLILSFNTLICFRKLSLKLECLLTAPAYLKANECDCCLMWLC